MCIDRLLWKPLKPHLYNQWCNSSTGKPNLRIVMELLSRLEIQNMRIQGGEITILAKYHYSEDILFILFI